MILPRQTSAQVSHPSTKRLTSAAVAKELGISRHTVIRLDKSGALPADEVSETGYRYWSLERVLEFRKRTASSNRVVWFKTPFIKELTPDARYSKMAIGTTCEPFVIDADDLCRTLTILINELDQRPPSVLVASAALIDSPHYGMISAITQAKGIALLLSPPEK